MHCSFISGIVWQRYHSPLTEKVPSCDKRSNPPQGTIKSCRTSHCFYQGFVWFQCFFKTLFPFQKSWIHFVLYAILWFPQRAEPAGAECDDRSSLHYGTEPRLRHRQRVPAPRVESAFCQRQWWHQRGWFLSFEDNGALWYFCSLLAEKH